MAAVKRSKTLPADGQTTKFLYTILKQLDLKSIDWNLVASQLEITNGHAARMRFSRFKQHMEGNVNSGRSPRAKKTKTDVSKSKKAMFDEPEPARSSPSASNTPVKKEPEVKPEPSFTTGIPPQYIYPKGVSSAAIPRSVDNTPANHQFYNVSTVSPADLTMPSFTPEPVVGYHTPPFGENWIQIKTEGAEGEAERQELYIKSEPRF